jgi:hypothetical protein
MGHMSRFLQWFSGRHAVIVAVGLRLFILSSIISVVAGLTR